MPGLTPITPGLYKGIDCEIDCGDHPTMPSQVEHRTVRHYIRAAFNRRHT
jgi:hypothetical protein